MNINGSQHLGDRFGLKGRRRIGSICDLPESGMSIYGACEKTDFTRARSGQTTEGQNVYNVEDGTHISGSDYEEIDIDALRDDD